MYGIGVTLAAAVLGRSPFVTSDEASLEAIVVNVANAPIPDLTTNGISTELAGLIASAMAKDPEHRPASAAEVGRLIRTLPPLAPTDPIGARATPGVITTPSDPSSPHTLNAPNPAVPRHDERRTGFVAAIGVAAAIGMLLVVALLVFGTDDPTEASGGEPVNDQPATTVTGEEPSTTIATTATTTSPPPLPLVLPLDGPTISNLLGIPPDSEGVDPLLGPADAPQVCDERPDITGMSETLAGVYPRDPTVDNSFRQVAQRMHRFSTPEQASAFIESYVQIPCDSWESVITSDGESSISTAAPAPSTTQVGDEISQVDITTTLPVGLEIYSRTVLVRSGTDVFKLFYQTFELDDLGPSTDILLDASIEALGF